MLAAGLALALGVPGFIASILVALVLLDIIGTGLCAWFLETPLLMAAMALAALGWGDACDRPCRRPQRGGRVMKKTIPWPWRAPPHSPPVCCCSPAAASPRWPPASTIRSGMRSAATSRRRNIPPPPRSHPDNAHNLTQAWSIHTGDVNKAGGAQRNHLGRHPAIRQQHGLCRNAEIPRYSRWSPTPARKNGPIRRDPTPRPENQGFKNRGVAYWQADYPVKGQACQKIVYIGTMSGTLHAVDARQRQALHRLRRWRHPGCQQVEHDQCEIQDRASSSRRRSIATPSSWAGPAWTGSMKRKIPAPCSASTPVPAS